MSNTHTHTHRKHLCVLGDNFSMARNKALKRFEFGIKKLRAE